MLQMQTLTTIEALADTDVQAALQALHGLSGPPDADRLLLEAELLARSGKLNEAFAPLDRIEASSGEATPAALFESRVLRASILAGQGRFDDAMPRLQQVITALDAHPSLAWLQNEARAELRAYANLVSPKSAATWSSLLT